MKEKAMKIVVDYIYKELIWPNTERDPLPAFEVYLVWMCKTLQNWKFLISSTIDDGMYYEVTYNGDAQCWYLDAYKKIDNRVIGQDYEN